MSRPTCVEDLAADGYLPSLTPFTAKPPKSYEQMHFGLQWERGLAAQFECVGACGRMAKDWAYQHGSPGEITDHRGRVFSQDFYAYAPMCRGCHRKYDIVCQPRSKSRKRVADIRAAQKRGQVALSVIRGAGGGTWYASNAAVLNAQIRRCAECGLETNPGALGSHQKRLGHDGWTEVSRG